MGGVINGVLDEMQEIGEPKDGLTISERRARSSLLIAIERERRKKRERKEKAFWRRLHEEHLAKEAEREERERHRRLVE